MKTFYSALNGQTDTLKGHILHHSRKVGSHLKKHHKKYIFGAVGGALLFKAITLIIAGIGINYSIHSDTFANNEGEYCYLTGQYLTGGYETGCYLTGQYLSEGTMTGCYMEGQYLTGGTLDEAGNLVDQYLEGGYLTGCYMEGQELTGGYLEGCHMEGQELTGGYMTCESNSGSVNSGENSNNDSSNQNPENNSGTCSDSAFTLISALSGAVVGGEISLDRQYCSENNSDITIQLFDHNSQRIDISTISGSLTGTKFDSKLLSTGYTLSGVDYGMYHLIAQNESGENYYTFTGSYTGNYTDYASGYQIRFIQDSNIIYSSDYSFTIDNKAPTVSLVSFNISPVYTGKAYKNAIAELIVQSSEVLSGVSFMVNNYAGGVTVTQSGNIYKIYQTLSSNNTSGTISYVLQYYDLASNAGSYSNTSNIRFLPITFTTTNSNTGTNTTTNTGTNSTGTTVTNTGSQTGSVMGTTLIEEIVKFNACKKNVSYKELKLNIHGYTYVLQMPEFKKTYVKKIINAFTLVVLSDIEANKTLTKNDLTSITNKFNNFLIVLKLVRDDDNKCKQGLSNYHIAEFKKMLTKYNLYSD